MENIDEILSNEAEPVAEAAPEPTPEPTPEPEPVKEVVAVEKTPEKPPEKYVPYGALHEERMLRKEYSNKLKETEAKLSQFETLREELLEIRRQKQAEASKKFEEDPVGALKERTDQLNAELSSVKQAQEEGKKLTAQQVEQQKQMQELWNETQKQTAEYAKEHEDYKDAVDFVMGQWARQAQVLGYTSQQQLDNALTAQAMAMAKHAMDRGQNPGQVVHELAKAWGFSPKKAETPKPTVEETINKLEKGQQAAKSLSSGGQPASGELSLKDIEDMSDQDFDKLWSDMERTARRR